MFNALRIIAVYFGGLVVPGFYLVRCGYKGWLQGFTVRAPAKIFITLAVALIAQQAAEGAARSYQNMCLRYEDAYNHFVPFLLFFILIFMLVGRKWSLEWQFSNVVKRDLWPLPIRILDSAVGLFLELLAAAFVIVLFYQVMDLPSPLMNAVHDPIIAVSKALPGWLNGVTLWVGSLFDLSQAVAGTTPGGQPTDICPPGSPTLGTGFLYFFWHLVLAPIVVVLSCEAFVYLGADTAITGGCPRCRGSGKSKNLLLLGSVCDHCGGYGGPVRTPAEMVTARPLGAPTFGVLIRAFFIVVIVFCLWWPWMFAAYGPHGIPPNPPGR